MMILITMMYVVVLRSSFGRSRDVGLSGGGGSTTSMIHIYTVVVVVVVVVTCKG